MRVKVRLKFGSQKRGCDNFDAKFNYHISESEKKIDAEFIYHISKSEKNPSFCQRIR